MPVEIGRAILKSALARATAGQEGARKVGAGLAGEAGTNVQALLEGLKNLLDGKAQAQHSHPVADLPVAASGESSTAKVPRADDARLSDARAPTAHKSSHEPGGPDSIAPSDIGAAPASHGPHLPATNTGSPGYVPKIQPDGAAVAWGEDESGKLPPAVYVTASRTASATDRLYLCNATSAPTTITLPTAVGRPGKEYVVKKTDTSANAVAVATADGQTIDGNATVTTDVKGDAITVESDGTNWRITTPQSGGGTSGQGGGAATNATDVSYAGSPNISATNVEAALDELDAEKAPISHAHAIADLPVAASGTSDPTRLARSDDSRLSNARAPTAHAHAIADLPVAASGTSDPTRLVRSDDSRLSGASGGSAIGAFSAYQATDTADVPHATWTKLTFATEEFDVSGWYNPADSSYTPQIAGVYRLGGGCNFEDLVDQKSLVLAIYQNGVRIKDVAYINTSGATNQAVHGTALVTANGTTDNFKLYINQSSGVAKDLLQGQIYQYFQGEFVGTL